MLARSIEEVARARVLHTIVDRRASASRRPAALCRLSSCDRTDVMRVAGSLLRRSAIRRRTGRKPSRDRGAGKPRTTRCFTRGSRGSRYILLGTTISRSRVCSQGARGVDPSCRRAAGARGGRRRARGGSTTSLALSAGAPSDVVRYANILWITSFARSSTCADVRLRP
jgi:hypothetical protein